MPQVIIFVQVSKSGLRSRRSISVGGGLNVLDGADKQLQIEQLYVDYTLKWFNVSAGVKHRDVPYQGLSTVNGDILWTGNARSIPGVLLKTATPISLASWLQVNASLGHYELNDDRFVDKARIHYKSLGFIFKISKNQQLTTRLSHYAQWAGVSPEFGKQAGSFSDYIRVVFGQNGGNQRNDQINTIGNHLGSYQINYNINLSNKEIDLYHQSLFEDRSGRELNNFPDGVWGVALQFKENPLLKTVLFEYVQTVSQSGRPRATSGGENQQSGGDNYFSNSIYQSGWSYQGNIIGLPFILRDDANLKTLNNRSYAFHFGAAGSYKQFDYSLKSTWVKNLGTYGSAYDITEKAIYLYGNLSFNSKIGVFTGQGGLDISNVSENAIGVGLGYQYNFNL
ncbi:hypothetical protein SCB49_12309 [unidentified eubacterium SCB49]|nr:hypothetical protein SCB49_12309 [unidentified eubacterium SCB49]